MPKSNKSVIMFLTLCLFITACIGLPTSLSNSVTNSVDFDGVLTVSYPSNWFAQTEDEYILLSPDSDYLTQIDLSQLANERMSNGSEDVPSNLLIVNVLAIDNQTIENSDYNDTGEASINLVMTLIIDIFSDSEVFTASPPEELQLDERIGAFFTLNDNLRRVEIIMMALPTDDGVIILVGATAKGKLERNREVFQNILASAEYDLPSQ
ncbi:MAG: hypothetical protein WBC91_20775 [Phototrophicaceae bacterium]